MAICVVGGMFTRRHEANARSRRIDDPDASLARLRRTARILLLIVAAGFLLMGDPRTLSGWLLVLAGALAAAASWRRAVVPERSVSRPEPRPCPSA